MKVKEKKRKRSFPVDFLVNRLSRQITHDLGSNMCIDPVVQRYVTDAHSKTLTKKFLSKDCDSDDLDTLTYIKFFQVIEHLNQFEDPGPTDFTQKVPYKIKVLNLARKIIREVLGDITMDEVFYACRNSGGVSIGVPFEDTSLESKMTYPLSTTADVVPLFERYLEYDPAFAAGLVSNRDNAMHVLRGGSKYQIVSGSCAATVSKTNKISRLIAKEPTLNMFFQQGLMLVMYQRLKKVGLDVRTLPKLHTELAWKASITGSHATIDFSSASDCVSFWLVENLLPTSWVCKLDMTRSPFMEMGGTSVDLPMWSTMGNATTFPLETLIFWALAEAVVQVDRKPHHAKHHVDLENLGLCSVFGDDCIVPTQHSENFMEVCEAFGFIVNREKSHFKPEDGFRESCGGDYYRGIETRGLYFGNPRDPRKGGDVQAWLYTMLNAIIQKYMNYFGRMQYVYKLKPVLTIFEEMLADNQQLYVVSPHDPVDSGLQDNGDLNRILRCWKPEGLSVCPIHVTKHGLVVYSYLTFSYTQSICVDEWLRYAVELKRLDRLIGSVDPYSDPTKGHSKFVSRRRNGGYVVRKQERSNWSPSLV